MNRRRLAACSLVPLCVLAACASLASPPAPPRQVAGRDHPVFSGLVTVAGGEYDHEADDSPLDADTEAAFYRVQVEGCGPSRASAGVGGGLAIEWVRSDNDLFADIGLEPTRAQWFEIAPYFLYRVQHRRRFRMPMRAGLYFQELELKGQSTGARGEWDTLGVRFSVEPEYVFHRRRNLELSLAGEVILGFGGTEIEFSGGGAPTQRFDSGAGIFGFEFGPRLRLGAFTAGISLLHRTLGVAESDVENGFVANAIDASFTGLAVTLGARF